MAGYADAPVAHPWPMQALPLLADPATGLVYGSPTSPVPVPLLPAAAAAAAATPYHLTASPPTSPERPPAQPAISAHPVRLASTPRGAKNAYLSDSSGDDVDDEDSSSSLCDSDDMSDAGLLHTVQTVPHAVTSSQLGSTRAPSDASSSEESGRSQSSSKRRVRFHETVAVVFNTRPPVTEDEDEDEDGGGEGLLSDPGADSGNGSSNASVGQSRSCGLGETCAAARPTPASPLAVANGGCATDDAFDDAGAPGHLRYRIPPSVVPGTASDPPPQRDGAAASRAHPTHRVETQPLRDHEAEREQWQKGVGEPAANGRRAPAWDQPPKSQEAQGRGPAAGEAGGNHSAAASDPVTEARRALLGHYSVPHPMHPVGNSIPRSGAMSPTLPRGSGVKIIGPQSFARARSCAASGAAQQPKCTLPSPKHRPHSGKPQSPAHQPARSDGHDLTRSAATPMARPAAGPKPDHDQQKARGVGWEPDAVRRSASCGASSDPDDVPLSAIARSKSEPLPGPAPEAGSAKHQYRLFGWPPKEQRGPVLVRNSTRAPSKDNSLARPAAAEARSASMDAARHVAAVGASPSGKRRLHRWGNII
ncbi:hypothetical protein H4R19_003520 [Coemansia spiralis]|nr:hypothetical protein H4R19_003520 [Coemansia spiralis]